MAQTRSLPRHVYPARLGYQAILFFGGSRGRGGFPVYVGYFRRAWEASAAVARVKEFLAGVADMMEMPALALGLCDLAESHRALQQLWSAMGAAERKGVLRCAQAATAKLRKG